MTAGRKAQEDAQELRVAAGRIRTLMSGFRDAPGGEFVPMSVANLLEAIAESVSRDEHVREAVRTHALEIAHHVPDPATVTTER